ncbi:hypothetical protein [Petrimonas sp.]|uniref:hypothetical protein n=1 Tax=Petrimonas sp. TaxID=2023866 RepID=UPI003F51A351
MKIKISPDFELGQSLLKTEEQKKLLDSLYEYCTGTFFNYPAFPRNGEFIDIEDIMWEWAKKYHKDSASEMLNKLWLFVRNELSVHEVTHYRSYISISCTDMYRIV